MSREHSDHVGDDEGGGRPGHQEEGDESHSLQEAQHRAFGSALPSARDAGLFLAAPGRRGPPRAGPPGGVHRTDSHELRDRRLRDGWGRPSPGARRSAETREGCGRQGGGPGWVGPRRPGLVAK